MKLICEKIVKRATEAAMCVDVDGNRLPGRFSKAAGGKEFGADYTTMQDRGK